MPCFCEELTSIKYLYMTLPEVALTWGISGQGLLLVFQRTGDELVRRKSRVRRWVVMTAERALKIFDHFYQDFTSTGGGAA